MSEVNSAVVARQKLASLLEAYAPMHVGRDTAIEALKGAVKEFEASIREDERAALAAPPVDSGVPGVDAGKGTNEEAPAPLPETFEGQPDPGTPTIAESVASGEPLREVSDTPPAAPTSNSSKKKNANK